MRAIRSRDSQMERMMASALWRRGVRFRRNVRTLLGVPDLANQRRRVGVFLDSCFWHGCPEHYHAPRTNAEYWADKLRRNRARDAAVTQWYQERAWYIVPMWEQRPFVAPTASRRPSACRNPEHGVRPPRRSGRVFRATAGLEPPTHLRPAQPPLVIWDCPPRLLNTLRDPVEPKLSLRCPSS